MPIVQASDIGPKYDLLLATRDGSTLPCLDRNGATQNLSQVAYMHSTNPQTPYHEATEIQRKDKLTQLSSAQVIDRDFDAWPQVDQKDWSDGQGQRVFSGQGEALGTVSNKSTKYWDGLGVLWPIDDYAPQTPVLANPDQGEAGARMTFAGSGVVAGIFNPNFSTLLSYAYGYMRNSDGHNILAIQTPSALHKIDTVPNSVNSTPFTTYDYCFGFGLLWLTSQNAGIVTLNAYTDAAPPIVLTSTTFSGNLGNSVQKLRIATSRVGNKLYVAVLYLNGTQAAVRLYDFSAGNFATFTDAFIGDTNVGDNIFQIDFVNDNLVVAGTQGSQAFLIQFNIPTQTWSTLVTWPNANGIYFCSIAGGLFALVTSDVVAAGFANTVNMWLIQGQNAQHIGPVNVQSTSQAASNVITGEGEPLPFSSYALFPIYYLPVGSTGTRIAIYAYDVLRGRLFKVNDIGPYDQFLGNNHGRRCSVVAPGSRPALGSTLFAQWMMGVPILSGSGSVVDVSNVQNQMMGVSTAAFNLLLQQGVQITSSLIDFTSAQNKLYRQVAASFTAIPADAGISVRVDVWLDQDPANLASVPDFSTGVVNGTGANIGIKQVKLPINRVARKLVYRITTVGPTSTPTAAVKLQSVAVQVATGWAIHFFAALARSAQTNGGQDAFASQVSGVDEQSAYNFIRQLWRLRGGECTITLPNKDSYNALIQMEDGTSQKPFGVSWVSNQPNTYQEVMELKIREDV